MKKGMIVGLILIFLILGMVSPVMAQPPSIPLALVGVEGCTVEHQGTLYSPQGNVMILSGIKGDVITIRKEGIIKIYFYIDPMETPILYIDMIPVPVVVANYYHYHRYYQLSLLERWFIQWTNLARIFMDSMR